VKVAIVINTAWNIYNYRRGLIKTLLDKGCEVVAIAPSDAFTAKLQALGCQCVHVPMDNRGMNPIKDAILFIRLWWAYKQLRPDFILHYTVKPNVYGTLAARLWGIKSVSNVSGLGTAFIRKGFLLAIVKMLYKVAFQFPQKVFFQNEDDRSLFLNLNLCPKSRTDVLPGSGIDLLQYQPVPYPIQKPFVFLLIARLLEDKGIKEYAAASRMLKQKGYTFDAQLIGFHDTDSKYNIQQSDLDAWQADGTVHFLGEKNPVVPYIAQAHCLVLPSYREGTPRSLLEAMALARPIVTSRVTGCKEVLEEGFNGYFCEVRNAQSLALSMEKMLLHSEAELAQLGKNGRLLAERKFDEQQVIAKYCDEMFDRNLPN
jgi:glycosyltransferase involved in cell wall biosynthesis